MNQQERHQKIINRVYSFLVKQGGPALTNDSRCAYRGEGGKKCAVGCLIPDSMYSTEMEDKSVKCLCIGHLVPEVWKNDLGLLVLLQCAHDSSRHFSPDGTWNEKFYRKMKKIAEWYECVLPELD